MSAPRSDAALRRRLMLAVRFRVLPWRIPASVVRYVGRGRPTAADIERGEELARRHGW